jgi:hypothetical protein
VLQLLCTYKATLLVSVHFYIFLLRVVLVLRNHCCLCDLVVRISGYRTEMYCVSCEVRTEFIYVMYNKVDRPCGLVVGVPGYRSRGPGSFPALPYFVTSNGSLTRSTQPRKYN